MVGTLSKVHSTPAGDRECIYAYLNLDHDWSRHLFELRFLRRIASLTIVVLPLYLSISRSCLTVQALVDTIRPVLSSCNEEIVAIVALIPPNQLWRFACSSELVLTLRLGSHESSFFLELLDGKIRGHSTFDNWFTSLLLPNFCRRGDSLLWKKSIRLLDVRSLSHQFDLSSLFACWLYCYITF